MKSNVYASLSLIFISVLLGPFAFVLADSTEESLHANIDQLINSTRVTALVFPLLSANEGSNAAQGAEYCTATLMKIDGTCALFTNSHCIKSEDLELLVSAAMQTGRDRNPMTKTKLIKRDEILDIAQLELPQKMEFNCQDIRNTISTDTFPAQVQIETSGYSGLASGKFKEEDLFSQYSLSNLSFYRLSAEPTDVLLQLTNIDVVPGMSGGFADDSERNFLGIHAHYIPFKRIALVIPPIAISHFLNSKISFRTWSDLPNQNSPKNFPIEPKNSSRPTGENSHGDPGENSHSDPGHSSGSANANPLVAAHEPNEGFPVPGNSELILLGVNGSSVDGRDDFYRLYNPNDSTQNLIFRPTGPYGYPDLEIRKKLLQRLQGKYLLKDSSVETTYYYAEDPTEVVGWKKVLEGKVQGTTLSIKGNELNIHTQAYPMNRPDGRGVTALETEMHLTWTMSDDGKQIFINGKVSCPKQNKVPVENISFTCKNQNYLKLICTSEDQFFSLALDDLMQGHLSLSLGKINTLAGQKYFLFRFADFTRQDGEHQK